MAANPFQIRHALRNLASSVPQTRLALLVAPAGSGKTVLLDAWREDLQATGHAVAWLSIGARHEAPAVFLEDWVDALRGVLGSESAPRFTRLLDALPHLDERDPQSLLRHTLRPLRELESPVCIFVDDFHVLPSSGSTAHLIDLWLREAPETIHWVIATRGARPASAARWLATDRAFEIDADDLSLRGEQVSTALSRVGVKSEALSLLLLAETGGWATGVQLACRALAKIEPEEREAFVRVLGEHENLFDYIAGEIVAGESAEVESLLGISAILGPVDESLLLEAIERESAIDVLEAAREKGLLLRLEGGVGVLPLWESFLGRRVRGRSKGAEWSALHARLARLVERKDPARALEIAFAGDAEQSVAELLDAHGRAWLQRGHYATVEAALDACSAVEDSVARLHLRALITARRQPDEGVASLEVVADRYREQAARAEESFALLDAFIVAANANQTAALRRILGRLLSFRRLARDPQVRAISLIMLSALVLSRGRPTLSSRILKRVRLQGLSPMIQGAATVGLTVYGRYVDWDETCRVLDEALVDRERTAHAPAFYLCQTTRALLGGLRAEVGSEEFEEHLSTARDAASAIADFHIAMSEMLCCDALGKLEFRAGHLERAVAAFARGAAMAEVVGEAPLEAALRGQLALVHLARGETKAAIAEAERAGDRLEVRSPDPNPLSVRFPAAVALRALAECGNSERAHALLRRNELSFRSPFAIAARQTAVLLARVEMLAGFETRARTRLADARSRAEQQGLRDFGTELDRDLLEWSRSMLVSATSLEIRMLGRVDALRDGVVVERSEWRGITTRRLLARIMVAGGSARREVLQAALWPDATPKRASGSLRVALTRLRVVLGKDAIEADSEVVTLDPTIFRNSDLVRLRAALGTAPRIEDRDDADAGSLIELYPGPFAPELYDDWAEAERAELHARFVDEALRRIRRGVSAGGFAAAAHASEQLLLLYPLETDAWRSWARAVAELDGMLAAARILDRGREILGRELGPAAAGELELADFASDLRKVREESRG